MKFSILPWYGLSSPCPGLFPCSGAAIDLHLRPYSGEGEGCIIVSEPAVRSLTSTFTGPAFEITGIATPTHVLVQRLTYALTAVQTFPNLAALGVPCIDESRVL